MKNIKKKGNRGELLVCKMFNERFGGGFNRVPNSGAYGSTHNLSKAMTVSMAGDLICPENFRFCVECKTGYDLDLQDLFVLNKSMWFSFLDQVMKDSERSGLQPMVIYKKDRKKPLMIVLNESILFLYIKNTSFNNINCVMNFKYENKFWTLMDFESVLKNAPENFWFKIGEIK